MNSAKVILCDAALRPDGWWVGYLSRARPEEMWGRDSVDAADSCSAEMHAILAAYRLAIAHAQDFPKGVRVISDCKPALRFLARARPADRPDLQALREEYQELQASSGLNVQLHWWPRERMRPAHILARTVPEALPEQAFAVAVNREEVGGYPSSERLLRGRY